MTLGEARLIDLEIRRRWETGRYRTDQIAQELAGLGPYINEAFVYNWIVERRLRINQKPIYTVS